MTKTAQKAFNMGYQHALEQEAKRAGVYGDIGREIGEGASRLFARSGAGELAGKGMNLLRQSKPYQFLQQRPGLAAGLGGGLAGAGLTQGMNSYADHRKQEMLRNLGFSDRLGLAWQLMTNPNAVANYL